MKTIISIWILLVFCSCDLSKSSNNQQVKKTDDGGGTGNPSTDNCWLNKYEDIVRRDIPKIMNELPSYEEPEAFEAGLITGQIINAWPLGLSKKLVSEKFVDQIYEIKVKNISLDSYIEGLCEH